MCNNFYYERDLLTHINLREKHKGDTKPVDSRRSLLQKVKLVGPASGAQ